MSRVVWKGDRYVFLGTYEERLIPQGVGFRWDPKAKEWFTRDGETAWKLKRYADGEAVPRLEEHRLRREETLRMSTATDAPVDIPCPEGLAYLPFQRAGIAYALSVLKGGDANPSRGVLLADEMG